MSGSSTQPLLSEVVSMPVSEPATVPTTPLNLASSSAGLTKNGTMSKMRSHRGNIPTLPQTKFCHLCSAKFTRTTHLNRHLKTHSNERLHECDRCHAQFTRSDLLARHKRTCCDSSSNRSRRKSCQSCADSKVRCDLQRPCTKCRARGRECVYTNMPAAIAETSASQNDCAPSKSAAEASSSPATSSHRDSSPGDGPSPQTSSETGTVPSILSTPPGLFNDPTSTSTFVFSPAPSGAYDIPPGISAYGTRAALPTPGGQGVPENAYFAELFSSEMYDGLFSDLFTSSFEKNPVVPGQHFHQDPTSVLTDRLQSTTIDQALAGAVFETATQLAIYPMPPPPDADAYSQRAADSIPENEITRVGPVQMLARRPMPTISEFYEYIATFLTTFLYHMPIVHVPTFLAEPRSHILVRASKAVGAMYANTTVATNYIDLALASVRDEIIAELSHATDYDTMIQLTLASALIQTIGMFHKDPDQRAKSNVYHGMIVMMLRMSGFVEKTRDWKFEEIDFSDPVAVQRSWREWVRHESAKRALWICYLHDCCHSIFFNLAPTFHTEQFTLGLPAEDALWTAQDATEWAALLQTPSPYGGVEARLRGQYLKELYFYLVSNNPDNAPRPFNVTPFGHFIMIHAMMRKLFEMYLRDRLPLQSEGGGGGGGGAVVDGGGGGSMNLAVRTKLRPHFVDRDRVFHVQILLHYWLQSWMESPETPRSVPEAQQRFCFNALPFYWLAQVGLVAYQEGLPPFDADGTYITSHEAKFNLLKKWEGHIRRFLESGEQTSTKFWDEVMKIRIETWQAESGFEFPHLLGFFHPPAR